MYIPISYSDNEVILLNYLLHHVENKELKRMLKTYKYSLQELKVIAGNLPDCPPCLFTHTKSTKSEPDFFS